MFRFITCSSFLAVSTSMAFADYTDLNSEYTLHPVDVWVDDYANDALDLANVVNCFVSNSRPDLNVNKTYTAKIDENKCGYRPDSDVPNKIADSVITTQLASNTTPFEAEVFSEATDGINFIANTVIEKGADEFPPYGLTKTIFYSPFALGQSYTQATSPFIGFVDIKTDGDDTKILTANKYVGQDNWGLFGGEDSTIATYFDGNVDNVSFISKSQDWQNVPSNTTPITYLAGRADRTHYFLAKADSSGNVNNSVCQLRNNKWSTVNDYKLFKKSDGTELDFSGSFDFKLPDGTRGYYSSWGMWLDGMSKVDPGSLATITNSWGATFTRSLQISPGKISRNLANGGRQGLSAANSIFDTEVTKMQCLGENVGGQYKCLGGTNATFPIPYADWVTNGSQTINRYGANRGDVYYLTGRNPANGFEPMTLYYDVDQDGAGLNANDVKIRFDFESDYYADTYRNYGSTNTSALGNVDYTYYHNLPLVKASDISNGNCTLANSSACTTYNWSFGTQPWNQTALVQEGGDVYEVSEPLSFDFTYDASKDRNTGITLTDVVVQSTTNPTGTNTCTDNNDGTWNCTLSTTPFDGQQFNLTYNGYNLDGFPWLTLASGWGYRHTRAFNPIDGTELASSDGTVYVLKGTNVREAFQETNTNNCANASVDLTFTNISQLGYNLSDLNNLLNDRVTYPLPTQVWADKPTEVSADACPVVHGTGICN